MSTNTQGKAPPSGKALAGLSLAALGVVYGDIGTSPLYALKECFGAKHGITPTPDNVLGVLSLIVWSMNFVVSYKYIAQVMRADNRGEGGILALLALVMGHKEGRRRALLVTLGLFGAALLYGDGVITPAISVLGAIEGIEYATPVLTPWVVPLTSVIIFVLFLFQKLGTSGVGKVFGPIMVVWFTCIALLGIGGITREPAVLKALNPWYAIDFFIRDGLQGFLILGAVVLVLTGGEALYADMGHFGKRPIRIAWFGLVLPALMLNYFGQAALVLEDPSSIANPFYALVPAELRYPMVVLATAAAIVASQALISGAFSLTQQAVQLGYSPRMTIRHTSEEKGQIYVPEVNWALMVACIWLVIGFRSSTNLAAAYGIAVTGTMAITTILFAVVTRERWGWSPAKTWILCGLFLFVDLAFFSANVIKFVDGGWFPIVVAIGIFVLMSTWKHGRVLLSQIQEENSLPIEMFLADIAKRIPTRVPGTAVFLTSQTAGAPAVLLHHVKHNKVLHDQVILLSVKTEDIPHVAEEDRVVFKDLGSKFYLVTGRYGFMDSPDVPEVMRELQSFGVSIRPLETTYYLGRETLIARVPKAGVNESPFRLAMWRKRLFIVMNRNAQSATAFFNIPANRVVEMGAQIQF